jgi:hypothetical protein
MIIGLTDNTNKCKCFTNIDGHSDNGNCFARTRMFHDAGREEIKPSLKGQIKEEISIGSATKIELEPYEAAICSHTLAQQGRLGQVKQLSVC